MKTLVNAELSATEFIGKFKNGNINIIKERYVNNGTVWALESTETSFGDSAFKSKFLGAVPFFKRLGGVETVEQGKKFGYGCTISTSICPINENKTVTYFFY